MTLTKHIWLSIFKIIFFASSCSAALELLGQTPQIPISGGGFSEITARERYRFFGANSPAYKDEVARQMIKEANSFASALNLNETLPIDKSKLVSEFVSPPRIAQFLHGSIGNICTSNYIYFFAVDCKLSSVEHTEVEKLCIEMSKKYFWPSDRINTNRAFGLATQFLSNASIDVKALNSNCDIRIGTAMSGAEHENCFVPIYWVHWFSRNPNARGSEAEVEFIEPTKVLLQLRVARSEYILRRPLVISNIDLLLSQTNNITK